MPQLLTLQTVKNGQVLLTKKYLVYMLRSFYEKLNVRCLRRALVEYYNTNCIALCGGTRKLQYMSAIPCCGALATVLLRALDNFLVLKAQCACGVKASNTKLRGPS